MSCDVDLVAHHFEAFPTTGTAYRAIWPLLGQCEEIRFFGRIGEKNSNQIILDFDERLCVQLCSLGAASTNLVLPAEVTKEYDFALSFAGSCVVVEVEKANREKILYDILKCHMYLACGAHYAALFLPKNYPHRHGEWDLFACGVTRYRQCLKYQFGVPEKLDRILLVGYQQSTAAGVRLTAVERSRLIAERAPVLRSRTTS